MEREYLQDFSIYGLYIDYSVFFKLFAFLFFLSVVSYTAFSLLKRIKPEKKEEIILDLKKTKETAYKITFLLYKYKTPYNRQLLKSLEKYKYRKKVEDFDNETKKIIIDFLRYIKVGYKL